MPTYDYKCRGCAHRWDEFQPITAAATRKCPECGKLQAERVIGAGAGILFKGTGFYQTDYRSEGYKQAAKKDQPAEAKSEKKADEKSDSKPSKSDD